MKFSWVAVFLVSNVSAVVDFCDVCQEKNWDAMTCPSVAGAACMTAEDPASWLYCHGICANYESLNPNEKELCHESVRETAPIVCVPTVLEKFCEVCEKNGDWDEDECMERVPEACRSEAPEDPASWPFCYDSSCDDYETASQRLSCNRSIWTTAHDVCNIPTITDGSGSGSGSGSGGGGGPPPCVPCGPNGRPLGKKKWRGGGDLRGGRQLNFWSPPQLPCCPM